MCSVEHLTSLGMFVLVITSLPQTIPCFFPLMLCCLKFSPNTFLALPCILLVIGIFSSLLV